MPLQIQVRFLLLFAAGWVNREQQAAIDYLRAENAVLRELLGGRPRFADAQRRRLAQAGHPLGRRVLDQLATIVTPDTILRWYRELIARKYDAAEKRGHVGRPKKGRAIADLVVRIAQENPGFGYTRIRDALSNLRVDLARATVATILRERGLDPAPERSRNPTWKQFLAAHWDSLAAADFFSVEVLTWAGLVRYQVLFVMRLATRRVELAGIVRDTAIRDAWMLQIGRNLTDAATGFLNGATHLILDRDPMFTEAFRSLLAGSGVQVVRLPPRSPNMNAYAERWVQSVRRECLDRLVLFGEGHLRRALNAYVAHYHSERHHQGLSSRVIDPDETANRSDGTVACRERLGGLLRYYYRSAA